MSRASALLRIAGLEHTRPMWQLNCAVLGDSETSRALCELLSQSCMNCTFIEAGSEAEHPGPFDAVFLLRQPPMGWLGSAVSESGLVVDATPASDGFCEWPAKGFTRVRAMSLDGPEW